MSKFSQLTRGMPRERVRSVVPGRLSRIVYRLGLRRIRWEMLRKLAIARLFWRLEWWKTLSLDESNTVSERIIGTHLDFVHFQFGDEWSRETECAPPVLPAGRPEEFPGGYVAFGIDGLSVVFLQLAPETARELTFDWRGGELAIHVLCDEEGKWMAKQPPESLQRLWVEMIHLLLDRRQPLQEKRVLVSKGGEGGFVCSADKQEIAIEASS